MILGVTGALVSLTVTVKVQVVPPVEQTTLLEPIGKVAPEGGLQTTVGTCPVSGSAQPPDAVGVV